MPAWKGVTSRMSTSSAVLTSRMSTNSLRVLGASWKVCVAWHMGLPWGLSGGAFRSTDQLKLIAAEESSSRAAKAVCAGGVNLQSLSESCMQKNLLTDSC